MAVGAEFRVADVQLTRLPVFGDGGRALENDVGFAVRLVRIISARPPSCSAENR